MYTNQFFPVLMPPKAGVATRDGIVTRKHDRASAFGAPPQNPSPFFPVRLYAVPD